MKKLKDPALLLVICFCILQGHFGGCYRTEIEITPAPPEEATTEKSGFFSGFKNFFRGSPTTTTTTTTTPRPVFQNAPHRPPPLTISQAPLMPLGPRPDTPSSSGFGGQPHQPPQWPQVDPAMRPQGGVIPQPTQAGTTHDQRTGISPNFPGNTGPQQVSTANAYDHRPGSLPSTSGSLTGHTSPHLPGQAATQTHRSGNANDQRTGVSTNFPGGNNQGLSTSNFPPGFTPYRPERPQPSGFDLSYGGGTASGRPSHSGYQPGIGLAPLTSSTSTTSTSTTTTMKPVQPHQMPSPQKPEMNIDLRYGSTTTTVRPPTHNREDFPPLPSPRRPSTNTREDFPALPAPKSPVSTPSSPIHPSSPSAWNTTPTPPRTAALTPSRPGSPATPPQTGNRVSFVPSAGPGTQSSSEKPLATDDEIQQLTESLYSKEVNSQLQLIQVNVQGKTRSIDSADEAPNPLLVVDDRALQPVTIAKMRPLFNNYEDDTLVNEHVTPNERREENEFLDAVMATSVMRHAMLFLQNKGIVTPDPKTHRDLVKELWFTQYSRGMGKVGSSGFEHVFVHEVKNGTLIGLHNWVYFYEEEKANHLDYKGYLKEMDVGTKAKVLKVRFSHKGVNKPVNTLFIGTSPELELALYTVCFKLRPDRTCNVSLGNSKFGIVTYSWRYRGKNLIGSAYPEI